MSKVLFLNKEDCSNLASILSIYYAIYSGFDLSKDFLCLLLLDASKNYMNCQEYILTEGIINNSLIINYNGFINIELGNKDQEELKDILDSFLSSNIFQFHERVEEKELSERILKLLKGDK